MRNVVQKHSDAVGPINVRIPAAVAMTVSQSRPYEVIAAGEVRIAKDRRSTLVLVTGLSEAIERRVVIR